MSYTTFLIMVIIFMAFISYNLFRALYFLVTRKEEGHGTARHLGWRIGLSMALFLLLMSLKMLGVVEDRNLDDVIFEMSKESEDDTNANDEGKTLKEIQQQSNPDGGRIRLKPQ